MAKMKKVFTLKVRLILLMLVIILPLTATVAGILCMIRNYSYSEDL